jgi:DinB superfamily
MDALRSATAEFSTILDLAAAELPQLTDTATRVDGSWSRKQILGHLIDSAANNHQRFVRGQLDHELVTQGYAQEQWVETERFNDREWNELVDFWLAYNRHLLHLMSHVSPERLNSIIRIGADEPVSLEYVMIDYVRHMKHHLKQIGLHAAIE